MWKIHYKNLISTRVFNCYSKCCETYCDISENCIVIVQFVITIVIVIYHDIAVISYQPALKQAACNQAVCF